MAGLDKPASDVLYYVFLINWKPHLPFTVHCGYK